MKKSIKMAALFVAAATMMVACNGTDKEGFKKTDNGLYYRFDKQNSDGQQVQEGDVLVGELTIRFDTTVIFTNKGEARRIAQASPNYEIKIGEGLLMMHVGDVATFAMDADSAAKYVDPNLMPANYKEGAGQKLYYEISLQDIVTREELEQERNNFATMTASTLLSRRKATVPKWQPARKSPSTTPAASSTAPSSTPAWRATPAKATSTIPSVPMSL